ncbi:hypothetical protein [African swine fever virus]|nr:hypothetical protein [African swine fever virus]UNZ12462.1 hypothetical protein [African swine fever virus]
MDPLKVHHGKRTVEKLGVFYGPPLQRFINIEVCKKTRVVSGSWRFKPSLQFFGEVQSLLLRIGLHGGVGNYAGLRIATECLFFFQKRGELFLYFFT